MSSLLRMYVRLMCESPLVSPEELWDQDYSFKDRQGILQTIPTNVLAAFFEAMKKWNLKAIPSSKSDVGFLGRGANGYVFDVVYDSRRCAVKVTFNRVDAAEYKKIMQFREKLPAIPKSALPEIIDQYNTGNGFCTLMENLQPLSKTMKMSISNFFSTFGKGGKGITKSLMAKLVKPFVAKLDDYMKNAIPNDDELTNYDEPPSEDVIEKILATQTWQSFKDDVASGRYWPGESQDPEFENGDYLIYTTLLPFDEYIDSETIGIMLSNAWKKFVDFGVTSFPESSGSRLHPMRDIKDPRAKKLLIGLRWLVQKRFIDGWDDVHYDNIMIRPSTGEFVVADVGNFEL